MSKKESKWKIALKESRLKKIEKIKNYKTNKERRVKNAKESRLQRRKDDPLFNMKCRFAQITSNAFNAKTWFYSIETELVVGCDYETAFNHIEKQFTKGMWWSNKGEWHIDHIIPLSSAKTKDDLIELCKYTNLQPLWSFDNQKKSDKIPLLSRLDT